MKFIKTCYGELINPAHVKHFAVRYISTYPRHIAVKADGVTIKTFDLEALAEEPNAPQILYEGKEWRVNYDKIAKKVRVEACAWLAELGDKLNGEKQ